MQCIELIRKLKVTVIQKLIEQQIVMNKEINSKKETLKTTFKLSEFRILFFHSVNLFTNSNFKLIKKKSSLN